MILWPALMYQALAAWGARDDRELDLFEEVILRLHAAGVSDTAELAERTRLNARLVAAIAGGLRDRSLLHASGGPTKWGSDKLEFLDEPPDTRMVRVFQEPRTGAVWPRVALQLPYVRVLWSRLPIVRLGTPGKPDDREALPVWPPKNLSAPDPPGVEAIRDALVGHRRAQRSAGQDVEPLPAGVLSSVHPVDEPPVPVLLATVAYGGGMQSEHGRWDIADPFGLSMSMPFLRRELAAAAERVQPVADALAPLEEDSSPADFDAEFAREELREEAVGALEGDHPEVFGLLVEVRAAVAGAPSSDRPQAARRDAVVAAKRVLEAAHRAVIARGCVPDAAEDLLGHGLADRDFLSALALELGFSDVPESLVRVRANKIRAVASGGGSLRTQIAYSLLQAMDSPHHPYRAVAAGSPDFLADLERVSALCDEAGHGWGEAPSQDLLEEIADLATRCALLLLGDRAAVVQDG